MGIRCECLHDPTISGEFSSWLHHCAFRPVYAPALRCDDKNNHHSLLDTDMYIDDYGQFHHALTNYGHPFGQGFIMETFHDFYNTIVRRKKSISDINYVSGCYK